MKHLCGLGSTLFIRHRHAGQRLRLQLVWRDHIRHFDDLILDLACRRGIEHCHDARTLRDAHHSLQRVHVYLKLEQQYIRAAHHTFNFGDIIIRKVGAGRGNHQYLVLPGRFIHANERNARAFLIVYQHMFRRYAFLLIVVERVVAKRILAQLGNQRDIRPGPKRRIGLVAALAARSHRKVFAKHGFARHRQVLAPARKVCDVAPKHYNFLFHFVCFLSPVTIILRAGKS